MHSPGHTYTWAAAHPAQGTARGHLMASFKHALCMPGSPQTSSCFFLQCQHGGWGGGRDAVQRMDARSGALFIGATICMHLSPAVLDAQIKLSGATIAWRHHHGCCKCKCTHISNAHCMWTAALFRRRCGTGTCNNQERQALPRYTHTPAGLCIPVLTGEYNDHSMSSLPPAPRRPPRSSTLRSSLVGALTRPLPPKMGECR